MRRLEVPVVMWVFVDGLFLRFRMYVVTLLETVYMSKHVSWRNLSMILRLQIYRGEQLLQHVVGFSAPGLFAGINSITEKVHITHITCSWRAGALKWSFGTTCDLATVAIQIICMRKELPNSKVDLYLDVSGWVKNDGMTMFKSHPIHAW